MPSRPLGQILDLKHQTPFQACCPLFLLSKGQFWYIFKKHWQYYFTFGSKYQITVCFHIQFRHCFMEICYKVILNKALFDTLRTTNYFHWRQFDTFWDMQAFIKALLSTAVFPQRFRFFTVYLVHCIHGVAQRTPKEKLLEFQSVDYFIFAWIFLGILDIYGEF